MSMIAINKSEKIAHLEFFLLWQGQTDEVLNYLNTNVEAKNEEKLKELITYIEKHQEEIIDYDLRKQARKEVGLNQEEDDDVHNQSPSNKKDCDSVIGKHHSPQKVKPRTRRW